jgi:hypothetical protein
MISTILTTFDKLTNFVNVSLTRYSNLDTADWSQPFLAKFIFGEMAWKLEH